MTKSEKKRKENVFLLNYEQIIKVTKNLITISNQDVARCRTAGESYVGEEACKWEDPPWL